jgi:hypothetical protein
MTATATGRRSAAPLMRWRRLSACWPWRQTWCSFGPARRAEPNARRVLRHPLRRASDRIGGHTLRPWATPSRQGRAGQTSCLCGTANQRVEAGRRGDAEASLRGSAKPPPSRGSWGEWRIPPTHLRGRPSFGALSNGLRMPRQLSPAADMAPLGPGPMGQERPPALQKRSASRPDMRPRLR